MRFGRAALQRIGSADQQRFELLDSGMLPVHRSPRSAHRFLPGRLHVILYAGMIRWNDGSEGHGENQRSFFPGG
jgi:hypothetical protein